jgi:hypothetical protein
MHQLYNRNISYIYSTKVTGWGREGAGLYLGYENADCRFWIYRKSIRVYEWVNAVVLIGNSFLLIFSSVGSTYWESPKATSKDMVKAQIIYWNFFWHSTCFWYALSVFNFTPMLFKWWILKKWEILKILSAT